jgi:copper(I)-binding protein
VSARAALAACVAAAAACRGAAERAPSAVAVTDAWTRPAPAGADAAAYLTLRNATHDTVVVVGVGTDVAREAALHASMTTGAGPSAMMHMAPVARAAVAPGDSLVLAPAGRHVMLRGLVRPLAAGGRARLVLRLASGDSLAVDVEVRDR